MLGLISNRFQASLLATGKLSLMLKQEDLLTIIEDSVYHHTLEALAKGIQLEIKANFRPRVQIDVAYMQDVFTQLLEHALKESEENSVIKIKVEENVKSVRITLSFEGMDEENTSSNEFDEFWSIGPQWNVHTGMNPSLKTSLPLLRQVVERHGGMLWVSNQQALSNYTVELPVADMKSWNRSA